MDLIERMGAAFVERECRDATDIDGSPITWENTGPMRREHLRRCMEAVLNAIVPEYAGRAVIDESAACEAVRVKIREIFGSLMTTLPRPDITVTHEPGKPDLEKGTTPAEGDVQVDVVISRDNKAKSYTGRGQPSEAIKQVVRAIIDDPATAEILP